jgi:hypothetical protein
VPPTTTTPGATTIGPFTLDASPLGAVPLGTLTIAAPRAPVIGALDPAPLSTGGGPVSIYGRYLSELYDVKVDGVTVPWVSVSEYEIQITVPSHVAGSVSVMVVTAFGTTTKANAITFVQAPLSVLSLSPSSGPQAGGTVVTVTGTGFFLAEIVRVNGFPLAVWSIVDDNTILATTDAVGGPGALDLEVAIGGDAPSLPFTFT